MGMRTIIELNVGLGGPYLTVKASNGEIMLVSEDYDTKSNCRRAAEGLKKRLLFAKIVEGRNWYS